MLFGKAPFSMFVDDERTVTSLSDEHKLNASALIVFTEAGIEIFASDEQPLNVVF